MCRFRLLIVLGALVICSANAANDLPAIDAGATNNRYDEPTALAASQAAMGQSVSNVRLISSDGKTIHLHELQGKPVLVSMIYTSCYHVCPTITKNLEKVVNVARDALGEESFTVLTVGFDSPVDTPDRMQVFAKKRNLEHPNWLFLSGDATSIKTLADDVGFRWYETPKGFDHMIQVTVLDAQGKVYRQVYGIAPEPPAIVEPLKEVLYGNAVAASPIEGLLNNIKLFCTVYDPTVGIYRFDYSLIIAIVMGLLALSGTAWFIVSAWRNSTPPGSAS